MLFLSIIGFGSLRIINTRKEMWNVEKTPNNGYGGLSYGRLLQVENPDNYEILKKGSTQTKNHLANVTAEYERLFPDTLFHSINNDTQRTQDLPYKTDNLDEDELEFLNLENIDRFENINQKNSTNVDENRVSESLYNMKAPQISQSIMKLKSRNIEEFLDLIYRETSDTVIPLLKNHFIDLKTAQQNVYIKIRAKLMPVGTTYASKTGTANVSDTIHSFKSIVDLCVSLNALEQENMETLDKLMNELHENVDTAIKNQFKITNLSARNVFLKKSNNLRLFRVEQIADDLIVNLKTANIFLNNSFNNLAGLIDFATINAQELSETNSVAVLSMVDDLVGDERQEMQYVYNNKMREIRGKVSKIFDEKNSKIVKVVIDELLDVISLLSV